MLEQANVDDGILSAREQARYVVHLPIFEGPLDLLLHLIEKRQMEITTISLMAVTINTWPTSNNGRPKACHWQTWPPSSPSPPVSSTSNRKASCHTLQKRRPYTRSRARQ